MKGKVDTQYVFIGIMVVIILVSAVGIYFLITMFLEAKQETANTVRLIEAETAKNEQLDTISTTYLRVNEEGYVEQFPDFLPDEESFVELVKELEDIAAQSGGVLVKTLGEAQLTEDAIEIDNPEIARAQGSSAVVLKGDGYAIVQIQATLRVRFDGLIEFLQYVNDSKYFINVDSLYIDRVAIEDGPDVVDAGMVLNAYVEEVKGL